MSLLSSAAREQNRDILARIKRKTVRCPALVHQGNLFQRVMVVDFNASGLGLDHTFALTVGQRVEIEVLTGHRLAGKVAWAIGSRAGVEFARPMSARDPTYVHLVEWSERPPPTLLLMPHWRARP
ncbi:MAG: PilZ domain-containing protein [Bacteroidota bacterium]|jgi:hypothetical protein